MVTLLEKRGFRVRMVLGILFCGMTTFPLPAETFEGCSWSGPDPDWVLARSVPSVDLVGSLGSEVINFLLDAGAPISFVSRAAQDPEVRFQHSEPTTIRELLDEVVAQTPGYRLNVVSGKLVVYPFDEGYDALVDLGDFREITRSAAMLSVYREFRSKAPVLRDLRPVLRPLAGIWGDEISVGGTRTVVEHLVSLVAGSPSATFVIHPPKDGWTSFGLSWADLIEDLLLVTPKVVEVGTEFQVVPRVILVDGTQVTLIGSGCGVRYETNESLLKIDPDGSAVAITKGTVGIQARYEGKVAYVKVEVGDG